MKINPNPKLFWFIKDNIELDLTSPASLEMYVQQVISMGRTEDVKFLLRNFKTEQLKQVFSNIRRFLSWEVRAFWEDFFADH